MQSFHAYLQIGLASALLAIRNIFRLVVTFSTLILHKMHIATKDAQVLAFLQVLFI